MSGVDYSSQLWLRDWSLLVGQKGVNSDSDEWIGRDPSSSSGGGDAVDLSNLRFTFKVTKNLNINAAELEAHINNVGRPTVQQIAKQYSTVWLSAGYRAPSTTYGQIFVGQITWYERGRETNGVDTYLTINAMCRDDAINRARINTVLPAGHTHRDIIQACADAMNVKVGFITKLIGEQTMSRARALFGMARDPLRDIHQHYGATCHVDDSGTLHMLGPNETVPGDTIVLNSKTGMIGVPAMTLGGGINARCLLNPNIVPGATVKINEADINQIVASQASRNLTGKDVPTAGKLFDLLHKTAGISVEGDGIYKVMQLTHQGDNRGNDWYTDMVLQSNNPNDPPMPVPAQQPKLGG